MTNEMNLMKMDERQRLIWFMANRGTLITVGAVVGLMPLCGMQFTYLNVVMFPVLFGIGIDGGLHLDVEAIEFLLFDAGRDQAQDDHDHEGE